ncbi:hypothetical protein BVX97_04990 [bacterium E08(2017)]|nr:hypothetical protein BVX97_04990 [bacterium E08(2017)]
MVTGCATPRRASYLDSLRDTTIPKVEFTQQPVQEALLALRTEWKKQTGTDMPIAQVTQQVEYDDPKHNLVTFRAQHISFLETLRIIASVSGHRLSFRENDIVLTDIRPGEYMSFQWKLDDETKAGLRLEDKPEANDIREALELRGVDFSSKDMQVRLLGDLVFIGGFRENSELAKAILVLVTTGYEVRKR